MHNIKEGHLTICMYTVTDIAVAQNRDLSFKNSFHALCGYFLAVACLIPKSLVGT